MNLQRITYRFYSIPDRQFGELVPIRVSITIDGSRKYYATSINVPIKNWDQRAQQLIGRSSLVKSQNDALKNLMSAMVTYQNTFIAKNKKMYHEDFKKFFNQSSASNDKGETIIKLFQQHNDRLKKTVGIDIVPKTYSRYECVKGKLKRFIKKEFKKEDLYLVDIKRDFITDFDYFMLTVDRIATNQRAKYCSILKKVIRYGIDKGYIQNDPFSHHRSKREKIDREMLTKNELSLLESKNIENERLSLVRDLFVFSCYTGYAYSDVKALKRSNINIGIDGKKWIFKKRIKTNETANVPLLPPALRIIEKYKDHPVCQESGVLLPIPSNQKMNAYLKEIADIAGINKKLTTHIARHTFATTVCLSNGVSLSATQKLLGHSNVNTTQIYAKVLETKLSEEMNVLSDKLFGQEKSNEMKKVN